MGKFKIFFILAVFSLELFANENEDYWPWGPLVKSEALPMIEFQPLKWLKIVQDNNTKILKKGRAMATDGKTELLLNRTRDGYAARVISCGISLMQPRLCSAFSPFFHEMHYCGYLNDDLKIDFLLLFYSGGTGLNADFNEITLLLSNKKGYETTSIKTFGGGPGNQFVKIGGNPHFILQSLESNEKCLDGKSHNFWIYNLFEIRRDKVYLANQNHLNFPKTVWYTYEPNSKQTDMLSPHDKAGLQRKSLTELKLSGKRIPHCQTVVLEK